MKAMIFAAGLGTRLRPLTLSTPKALVEIQGKTLLEHNIEKLINSGIDEIIINIHHFPEQIIDFVESKNFKIPIRFSNEKEKLLDTGGGLKKAASFFDNETFLIYNVDILCDIELSKVISYHKEHKPIATLVVRERKTKRYLLFDESNTLAGWKNIDTGEEKLLTSGKNVVSYAFSGIHIAEPCIFDLMPDKEVFSMIDLYLEIGKNQQILAYVDKQSKWTDIGRFEQLKSLRGNL